MSNEPRKFHLRHRRRPLVAWVAGTGPPVVLLHGWGLSGNVYRPALRALAERGYRGIAPTVAAMDVPWTLEGVAERVAEVMAGLDATPAPVVGHSFGGVVGLRVAIDHPEFVSAFVAVDSPLVSPGKRGLSRLALPGRHYRIAAHVHTARALGENVFRRGGLSSLAGAARFILGTDLRAEIASVRRRGLPAAVLWAERDTLLPRSLGERAAEALGCPLEVIGREDGWPGRHAPDHDWPMRAPRVFVDRITAAIERLSVPPAAAPLGRDGSRRRPRAKPDADGRAREA